ncbi:Tfp pilus assembly protein PilO [Herbaspirillum seropedicae]|nr:Tfp pilus assembly protein PilO [Herbaspirillum seropedicae]
MRRTLLCGHPAHWPQWAQVLLLLAITLLCAGSGLLLAVQDLEDLRQQEHQRQQALRIQLQAALRQSAQLAGLIAQQRTLEMQLHQGQEQGWSAAQAEGDLLHAKLARRAAECALALESFQPNPDRQRAAISLRGQYAGLLCFVELVSQSPLPLLLESLEIVIDARPADTALRMSAQVFLPPVVPSKENPHDTAVAAPAPPDPGRAGPRLPPASSAR